ncbi:arginine--tRNA ligase [Candidatus Woesebacteria bacterium]|nr:arginine--tRNA ligase [Candidatus Woesebacteria bacterium]
MKIQKYIQDQVLTAAHALQIPIVLEDILIERPVVASYGDYATSVALMAYSKAKKSSTEVTYRSARELAESLTEKLLQQITTESVQYVKNVQVAGPGFINIILSDQYYLSELSELLFPQESLLDASKPSKTIILEYISPNTNKPLHIGHVRNAALGVSMSRVLTKMGWIVHKAIINNDRGLHIMKSVWGYLLLAQRAHMGAEQSSLITVSWQTALSEWMKQPELWQSPEDMTDIRLKKSDHFVGNWYQQAEKYAEVPAVQQSWSEMLQAWEQPTHEYHQQIRAIWEQMNGWFYQGFAQTATTLHAEFDPGYTSYESQVYEAGRQVILKALDTGAFERLPDGAVRANLSQFNLADKIMIRKDGTGLYVLQDIELLRERAALKPEKVVYIVGVDQQLYFQQLFAIAQLLGYGKQENFQHFAYGMVRLPEGKMSSRKGLVIYADDLLAVAQERAALIMRESGVAKDFTQSEFDRVAQAVGVGAVQWTLLSHDPTSEVIFDIEKSVNFTGFAGPYIQYTLARTHSIFKKAEISDITLHFDALVDKSTALVGQISAEERDILVHLSRYFDVLERVAKEYAPHLLCLYLDTLAQSFNAFYAHHKIVSDEASQTQFRLALTKAVQIVITDGLTLLGIEPIERM